MSRVTVRYWAAARAAAGRESEPVEAATVAGALAAVCAGADRQALAAVVARCSVLVDGVAVTRAGASTRELADGSVVEVLPPFAGG